MCRENTSTAVGRPASYSSSYVFLVLSRVITGAAGVATFPRQVEYGVQTSTVVARSCSVPEWLRAGMARPVRPAGSDAM